MSDRGECASLQICEHPPTFVDPVHFPLLVANVRVTERLINAARAGVVITPNERLARHVARALNARMRAPGNDDGATDVVSVRGWFKRTFLRQQAHSAPTLLEAAEQFSFFADVRPEASLDLVPAAIDAWELLHMYQMPLLKRGNNDALRQVIANAVDGRVLLEWMDRADERLRDERLVTLAELPALLAGGPARRGSTPVASVATWLESDQTPPSIHAYRTWYEHGANRVHTLALAQADRTRVEQRAAIDDPDELAAAAEWARQKVSADPQAQVGVVIPDLHTRSKIVQRVFAGRLSPDTAGPPYAFNLGAAAALADSTLWAHCRRLLAWCLEPQNPAGVKLWRQSPFLFPDAANWTMPTESDLPIGLQPFARGQSADVPNIHAVARVIASWPSTQTARAWQHGFLAALTAAGLDLNARPQNRRMVNTLESQLLAHVRSPVTGPNALALLDRALTQVADPGPGGDQRVQILGSLESLGLQFTHLWVCGLTANDWPATPRPNPLLPAPVQSAFGVPRILPQDEADFAARTTRHWCTAADHVVLSWPESRDGAPSRPSRLIHRDLPNSHASESPRATRRTAAIPRLIGTQRPTEILPELRGSRVSQTRLNVQILTEQAQCPFRAWAIHRLEANDAPASSQLSRQTQGMLAHELLRRWATNGKTHDDFAQVDHAALQQLARRTVADCAVTFPPALIPGEVDRLARLVADWAQVDARRGPFRIVETETLRHVRIHGESLRVRLDRVDKVSEALFVLDYKTADLSIADLMDVTTEPQLAVYALSDRRIEGVAYAILQQGRCRIRGVATTRVAERVPGVQALNDDDWNALRERWASRIAQLADDYRSGVATPMPTSAALCRRCRVDAVCRASQARP